MINIEGIVRRVEDLLAHAGGNIVYVSLADPLETIPGYRRPYVHIGRGEFVWAYEDARDGYTIRELLSTWYPAGLVFAEAGHFSFEGDKAVYKALVSA